MKKRLVSLLLAVLMVFGTLAVTSQVVLATETPPAECIEVEPFYELPPERKQPK